MLSMFMVQAKLVRDVLAIVIDELSEPAAALQAGSRPDLKFVWRESTNRFFASPPLHNLRKTISSEPIRW